MAAPPIAIFGKKDDKQVITIKEAVSLEGGVPLLFNMRLGGPESPRVSLGKNSLSWDGTDFTSIEAVHIRAMAYGTPPALPPALNETFFCEWRTRFLKEQVYQSFTYSFFDHLARLGKLVINRLSTYIDHDSKAQFYEKMRSRGFPFPRTLTTNDRDAARAFIHEVKQAVVKPGIGVGSTRLIDKDNLRGMEDVPLCPITIQEFIPGKTVRVHIVGDTVVLALKVLSDGIDSRTETSGFEYVKLSDREEERIVSANRSLGLLYAAWDVIEAEDGRVVYLDCNPGPYVMWIGKEPALAVFRQLAAYMVNYSINGSVEEASSRVVPWKNKKSSRA